MRRTIASEIHSDGMALHAGRPVRMTLSPAEPGTGIVFRRSDVGGREIPARYDRVGETQLGTVIADGAGASAGVIEHVMAAIAGLEIDDLLVTLDGPEPPILDGDALGYMVLLEKAGFREVAAPRPVLRIRRSVTVESGNASATLEPADGCLFDFEIVFDTPAIGTQRLIWAFSRDAFRRDIAPARTFGFLSDLEKLNKMGLGKGASLENTLAIDDGRVVNASLMRFPDEFVRHKILDAIGDLALAGAPFRGRFVGRKSGHALNNALLRAVFADEANYEWCEAA